MIETHYNDLAYLQFRLFSRFQGLVHGIFTRAGGVSKAPYEGLNTSTSLKIAGSDRVENVIRNRQMALDALGLKGYPCVTLWQVHGADVEIFERHEDWRTDWASETYYYQPWTPETIHKGDAIVTRQPGIAIALSFADCVPLIFYDPVEQVIGVTHGGWRGTARGISISTVETMRELGCQPRNIRVGIGPCIGPCCYEVSDEVRELFLGRASFESMPTRDEYRSLIRASAAFSTRYFNGRESLRLDLAETHCQQLINVGILPEHIEVAGVCTSCHVDQFFSYRAEGGRTGRFPVIIALN